MVDSGSRVEVSPGVFLYFEPSTPSPLTVSRSGLWYMGAATHGAPGDRGGQAGTLVDGA